MTKKLSATALEEQLPLRLRLQTITLSYPRYIGGTRACPPEDCGGVYAYAAIVFGAMNEDTRAWLPIGYDPARFDSAAVRFHDLADAVSLILLAPCSRGKTWDVIERAYGPDVAISDQALAPTFAHYSVDLGRLPIGDFSNRAAYTLSLGLPNGGLFSHILAFSPGFGVQPAARVAAYVSNGTRDQVLPIEACSQRIVPRLERGGYDVWYHEFERPHTVPAEIACSRPVVYQGRLAQRASPGSSVRRITGSKRPRWPKQGGSDLQAKVERLRQVFQLGGR